MSAATPKNTSLKAIMVSGAAFAALMSGSQAYAQAAGTAQVEEVVVTGSSIRGVAPVGSALIGVTREQINAVAPTNVKDMLATVPALGNFGTNAEQSTPNRFRTQGYLPNIHNLGIYATLTLLNGHRVAATGTEGTYPDPSSVPPIAIERTEIIADGASAIYGSDAVAGVVNFVYRKPFNGIETTTTYSFDNETRYEKRDFGIIAGHLWDWNGGGGVMAAYEYSTNLSPLNTEIPFLALGSDQTSRGGRDLRGTNCNYPNFRKTNPNGTPTGTTYGDSTHNFSTAAVDQRCGIIVPGTVISDGKRNAVIVTANQQLTDSVKAWAELNYSHFVGETTTGKPNITVIVPRSNPFFTAANIPPALFNDPTVTRVQVVRSSNGLFANPSRHGGGTATVATAVVGLDIDLGRDWKGTLSLDVSRTRDTNGKPGDELDTLNIIAAVNDPNPATALNLFGINPVNNPATLAKIDNGSGQLNWGQQGLQELQFKADGPLMELPGGTLRAAVGASFRATQANELQLGGSRNPNAGYNGVVRDDHPRQQVEAAFFELNAPIVSGKNELPLIKEFTVSIAGRFDQYDKYGGKFNPKYGVIWSPVDDLRFHASYGTNFDAPNVGLLSGLFGQPSYNSNQNATIGYGPYKGILLNNINAYVLSGQGGGNLTPERAKTYSFGGDWTPQGLLSGLHVGVNYYHVNYTNLFFKITGSDLITNEQFAAYAEFFPTAARIAEIIKLYPPSSPITVPNFEYVNHTEAVNLGTRIFEGMDYDMSYRFRTDSFGQFQVGMTANQQLKFDQQVLAGGPFQSRLKTTDAVKWKLRYSAGWIYENLTLNAFVNYTGSYINVSVTPQQLVKNFITTDLSASYEFKNVGFAHAKGVTLQARVVNLFNRDPPFYDAAAGYNANLASPFPRSFDLTLRTKF